MRSWARSLRWSASRPDAHEGISLVGARIREPLRIEDVVGWRGWATIVILMPDSDMGQAYLSGPTATAGSGYQIRVTDASDNLIKGLADGHIDALIIQDPVKMGYLAVKTLVSHIKGEKVEKRIDTGIHIATRENMEEPVMKELLKPDLSKWLK